MTTEAIGLPESSYGATQSALVVLTFEKLSTLKEYIRIRRWRRYGENPGQAYMGSCELVAIHHGDYEKAAVLKCSTHYDI
jgi:hypothetical protein